MGLPLHHLSRMLHSTGPEFRYIYERNSSNPYSFVFSLDSGAGRVWRGCRSREEKRENKNEHNDSGHILLERKMDEKRRRRIR